MNSKENLKLYSLNSILLLSALFTPLFGAIAYCINLKTANKKNFIFPTVAFVLIYNFLMMKIIIPHIR